ERDQRHPEEHRGATRSARAGQSEEPFVLELAPQPNRRRDLEDAGEDRPGGDEGEQHEGRDVRQRNVSTPMMMLTSPARRRAIQRQAAGGAGTAATTARTPSTSA